jgi:hypothetical protein
VAPTSKPSDQPGEVSHALALILPTTLLLGPFHAFSNGSRSIVIYWFEIAIVGLALHLLFMRRWARREWLFQFPLLSLAALAPAVLVSADRSLAVIVLYRFAMGLVGGWALASLWSWYGIDRWSPIDTGLVIAGVGTSLQLSLVLLSANVATFHEAAALSWGASNYVAAVLVVLGLTAWGRMVWCSVNRAWIAVPVAMLGVSVLTLSRATVIALLAGVAFAFLRGFSPGRRWGLRPVAVTAIMAPAGYWIYDQVTQLRLTGTSAAHLQDNIQSRLDLIRISLSTFLASPLVGGGLGSLQESSLASIAQALTYAHNVEFSLLGQAGLMSLPYLALIALSFYAVFRTQVGAQFRPAAVALLVISQTQPMFEGIVGGTFALAVLFVCFFAWLEGRAQRSSRRHADPLRWPLGNRVAIRSG